MPRVGVVHVPKCAGASLRAVVTGWHECYDGPKDHDARLIGAGQVVDGAPTYVEKLATPAELATIFEADRLVVGHFALCTFVDAGVDAVIVLVREPRSRLLSLHDYWRSASADLLQWGERGRHIADASAGSFEDFLRSPLVRPDRESDLARYLLPPRLLRQDRFGGIVLDPTIASGERPEEVEQALEESRPRLLRAYWPDELDAVASDLRELVGHHADAPTPRPMPRLNPSPDRAAGETIDRATTELLAQNTVVSDFVLEWLMGAGLLSRRSREELDREFLATAATHGYLVS